MPESISSIGLESPAIAWPFSLLYLSFGSLSRQAVPCNAYRMEGSALAPASAPSAYELRDDTTMQRSAEHGVGCRGRYPLLECGGIGVAPRV
jgi:hypothetical protein